MGLGGGVKLESLRSRDLSSIPKPIIQQETVRWMDEIASGFHDVPSGRGINSGHLFHSEYQLGVCRGFHREVEALHPTLCLFVSSRVHSVRMFQYQHQSLVLAFGSDHCRPIPLATGEGAQLLIII